jgi:hypothetical protein
MEIAALTVLDLGERERVGLDTAPAMEIAAVTARDTAAELDPTTAMDTGANMAKVTAHRLGHAHGHSSVTDSDGVCAICADTAAQAASSGAT